MEARQGKRDIDGVSIASESGVDALKMQSSHAPKNRIRVLRERVRQRWQRFLIPAKLRQRHGQERIDLRQAGFQPKRLAERRDRVGELALLKVDQAEARVDLTSPRRELSQ